MSIQAQNIDGDVQTFTVGERVQFNFGTDQASSIIYASGKAVLVKAKQGRTKTQVWIQCNQCWK